MSDLPKNESAISEDQEHQQDGMARTELSPGAQLSARRQALDWSVEQVASQLNLAPRQIRAIEADNYSALPGMAIVRGFIRSYAKLLNVDAIPLLQIVAKEATPAETSVPLRRELPNIRYTESRLSPSGRQKIMSRSAFVLLLLALLAGGLIVMQQTGTQHRLPAFLQFGAADVPIDLTSRDILATVPVKDAVVSETANTGAVKLEAGIAPDPVAKDGGKKPDASPNEAATLPAGISSAGTKDMLTLKLREDSWVEIKRPDNSTVVSALLKAGNVESFNITSPVEMTVGNAAGVDATLRGKPLELKADAKNNVARLILK